MPSDRELTSIEMVDILKSMDVNGAEALGGQALKASFARALQRAQCLKEVRLCYIGR